MADVEYLLGNSIALNQMLPGGAGIPATIPGAIPSTGGLYIIYNQNTHNRYMGISDNLRTRFSQRQGTCFELGFPQAALNNIFAFVGIMRYRNDGAVAWTAPHGYVAGSLTINLDGVDYDLEHLFIKAVQHIWFADTITNTVKTSPLTNTGSHPINVSIFWNWAPPPAAPPHQPITLASGNSWL